MIKRFWLKSLLFFVSISFLSVGCATSPKYNWKAKPLYNKFSNEYVDVELHPFFTKSIITSGCQAFRLFIINKTQKNIEVDWNKTMYIVGGRTNGGFMYPGILYLQRNNPKQPDVIFAKSSFEKMIWPCNLVEFSSGRHGRWRHEYMPLGQNGIYLVIRCGDEEIREKITLKLSLVPVH